MRGGKRTGAGRRKGSGAFGEPTHSLRVPLSLLPKVIDLIESRRVEHDRSKQQVKTRLNVKEKLFALTRLPIQILPPSEAGSVLEDLYRSKLHARVVMLDPWYEKPREKTSTKFLSESIRLLQLAGQIADHVFYWGWPRQLGVLLERIPPPLIFRDWISWYYRNAPSRSWTDWRGGQQACLHLSRPGAPIFPQHFFTPAQQKLWRSGRMRYVPAPCNVIEAGLTTERFGPGRKMRHPARKPERVFDVLLRMTCTEGDLVVDPTAGSGTTGLVARGLNLRALLSDQSPRYTQLITKRLSLR